MTVRRTGGKAGTFPLAWAALVALCCFVAPAAGQVPARPSGGQGGRAGTLPDERIEVRGGQRAYRLVVPENARGAGPVPLVFAFHGFRVDSKDVMPRYTRLDDLARREGFILAYPNALEQRWRLRVQGNEDLALFDALSQRITTEYNVDRNRVYATGMSNGAYFANLLASQRSDVIAAITPHSGGLGLLGRRGIQARRKYAVMIIHGTDDRLVPVSQARKADETYRREGHEVLLVEIPGLGHRWATQANINDRIWEFFRAHPLQ